MAHENLAQQINAMVKVLVVGFDRPWCLVIIVVVRLANIVHAV